MVVEYLKSILVVSESIMSITRVFKMAFNGKKWREVSSKIPLYWKRGKSSISVLFTKYYNKQHGLGKDQSSIVDERKKIIVYLNNQ